MTQGGSLQKPWSPTGKSSDVMHYWEGYIASLMPSWSTGSCISSLVSRSSSLTVPQFGDVQEFSASPVLPLHLSHEGGFLDTARPHVVSKSDKISLLKVYALSLVGTGAECKTTRFKKKKTNKQTPNKTKPKPCWDCLISNYWGRINFTSRSVVEKAVTKLVRPVYQWG